MHNGLTAIMEYETIGINTANIVLLRLGVNVAIA